MGSFKKHKHKIILKNQANQIKSNKTIIIKRTKRNAYLQIVETEERVSRVGTQKH
jgi:hypothetical protein